MRTLELMFITWLVLLQVAVAQEGGFKKQSCRETCGNLTIEYPFGIREGCYLNQGQNGSFKVNCNPTDGVATLAAPGSSHEFIIKEIRLPNHVLLEAPKLMAVDCRNNSINTSSKVFDFNVSITLPKPFMVSSRDNRFRAMGCDTTAYIKNNDEAFRFRSQCQTQWMLSSARVRHGGLGQCQIAVPEGSSGYNYSVTNQFDYAVSACWRNCSYAFLADEQFEIDGMVLNGYADQQNKEVNTSVRFPLVGEWVIKDRKCIEGINNSATCGENAWCNYTSSDSGYNCYCYDGFIGNPYKACWKDDVGFPTLEVALAGGFVLAATLGASSYAYGSWAQKKLAMKMASKFLRELANSGDSLSPDTPVDPDTFQDMNDAPFDGDADPDLEGDGGPEDPNAGEKPRDFNQQDLKKAIKVYQKGRRVALWARRRMVARANLANQAVEIRKYTVQERGQLQPFVIGVRTLSRTVIHANVARLLGISTRESSLIYRHFSDKTLHDRLHRSGTNRPSWEERWKIAVGTARGLAFAHSKGVYHGNVKSSNILLDEGCNCKVVDFGVVRVWRRNKLLNSSKGYVDPEYLNQSSNRLTSKMDVYSFGVVLVELITGQDPSAKAFNQRGSLVMQFMLAVEQRRLQEFVHKSIWAEERRAKLEAVAVVATQCLKQEAKERPKMLDVWKELWKIAPELHTAAFAGTGRRPVAGKLGNLQGRVNQMQGQVDKAQGQVDKWQGRHDQAQGVIDEAKGQFGGILGEEDE